MTRQRVTVGKKNFIITVFIAGYNYIILSLLGVVSDLQDGFLDWMIGYIDTLSGLQAPQPYR
jgi:hypothetical protein